MTLWSGLRLGYRLTRLRSRHLSEAELVGLLVPGSDVPTAGDAASRVHLSQCRSCAGRSADLQSLLDVVSETAQIDAKTHMSTERLTSQREKIVRRLRRSVEPAQAAHVLRFPSIAHPTLTHVHRAGRWLTAAAVSGLDGCFTCTRRPNRPTQSWRAPPCRRTRWPRLVLHRPRAVLGMTSCRPWKMTRSSKRST